MRVVFSRASIRDLEEIAEFISRNNRSAAILWSSASDVLCADSRSPRSARAGSEPGTHELVVPGLPYIVAYRVVEGIGRPFVDIIAVFHAARDRRPGDDFVSERTN
jgi:toxin ParE1/3/4